MAFAQRLEEIRAGFQPPFWVANFTEIFERVAYYATHSRTRDLSHGAASFFERARRDTRGIAGFVVYALAILAGTLADRFGFRRTLLLAYLLLTTGYFLLGSLETSWMAPLRHAIGDKWLVSMVLLVPSLGPGLVKPVVAGTTARASSENVRSLGYSIYYTLVNIGGTVGPLMAWVVREKMGWGIANVFPLGVAQRVSDVLGDAVFLSRAGAAGRRPRGKAFDARLRTCSSSSEICATLHFC